MDQLKSIVITSTFAAEPLRSPLSFWLKRVKLAAQIVFAPELQLFQNLLDKGSALHLNPSGLNAVLLRWQDLDDGGDCEDRVFTEVMGALRVAAQAEVPLFVVLCPSNPGSGGVLRRHRFSHWDKRLVREFDDDRGVSVITASEWQTLYPIRSPFERGSEEFALLPYAPATYAVLATLIARKFHMLTTAPYKVIAVDCDDTLWDGLCGEAGPHGVRLQAAHLELQEFLRSQLRRGCLLCLCSKNNLEDVEAVFRKRSDMVLRWDEFAAVKVNWRPKPENLLELADELGLDTDSFIFIDDNPIECEMVKQSLPNVLTLQLPSDRDSLGQFLRRVWAFDRPAATAEDRQRISFYHHERERQELRQKSTSLEEFIQGLDLKVDFKTLGEENLSRASQLTFRVNQFNTTTIRRSEADLARLRRDNSLDGWLVDVSDRFGAYGLVGLVLFRPTLSTLLIDTFLLSCRTLGRGVEHRIVVELALLGRALGLDSINFSFVASGKNQPAGEFLQSEFDQYGCPSVFGTEYRVPVERALAVRYRAMGRKSANLVSVDNRAVSGEDGGSCETGAGTLAWIARELVTGEDIQSTIVDCTRQENESQAFIPPRNNSERQIAGIWADVLGLTQVGPRDNFFEIGGDSLAMVRIILRVNELTGFELPVRAFFEAPTIEQQLVKFPLRPTFVE